MPPFTINSISHHPRVCEGGIHEGPLATHILMKKVFLQTAKDIKEFVEEIKKEQEQKEQLLEDRKE